MRVRAVRCRLGNHPAFAHHHKRCPGTRMGKGGRVSVIQQRFHAAPMSLGTAESGLAGQLLEQAGGERYCSIRAH